MKKKAQFSVPIVIGLIILVLAVLFIYKESQSDKRELSADSEKIKSFNLVKEKLDQYVAKCVEEKALEEMERLWVSGEEDISGYIDEHLSECLDDFTQFKEEGFDVSYSGSLTTAQITEGKVEIKANISINISREDQKTEFHSFYLLMEPVETHKDYVINFDMPGFDMPFKNIAYKEEYFNGLKLYIIKMNLNDKSLKFLVTPKQAYLEGTTEFLAKNKLQLAVNGGGWNVADYKGNWDTDLTTYSQGNLVCEGKDFAVTVTLTEDNRVILGKKPKDATDLYNVVTGFNLFVLKNEVSPRMFPGGPGYKEGYDTRDPRTSIGYDEDKNILNIILVDSGVVGQRMGLRLRDLGTIHVREGSDTAINMDGGGSSTLVMEGQGIMNAPSDGHERPVATHLGVWAEKLDYKIETVKS
ncbi:MAG: phosphodiester glycosidase family protein [Candidatus Woesearchaeota archaeon]|nr:phosphodiester glycosidase family protein [Candidatus Woesearchaeota archaeon]